MRARVEELYADYAAALDGGEFGRWPGFFADDAVYRVVTRENHLRGLPLAVMSCDGRGALEDRVVSVERTSTYAPRVLRHVVSLVRTSGPDGAAGPFPSSASFAVYETIAGEATRLFASGVYDDALTDTDNGLRFASRTVVLDNEIVPTSLIVPL